MMSKNTYTISKIKDIVYGDGLEFAITDIINPEQIEDDYLRRLWFKAKDVLEEIQYVLDEYPGDNEYED